MKQPLTLALSPSDGERESLCTFSESTPSGEWPGAQIGFSLAPSDGERAGVRGISNCIVTA